MRRLQARQQCRSGSASASRCGFREFRISRGVQHARSWMVRVAVALLPSGSRCRGTAPASTATGGGDALAGAMDGNAAAGASIRGSIPSCRSIRYMRSVSSRTCSRSCVISSLSLAMESDFTGSAPSSGKPSRKHPGQPPAALPASAIKNDPAATAPGCTYSKLLGLKQGCARPAKSPAKSMIPESGALPRIRPGNRRQAFEQLCRRNRSNEIPY